MNIDIKSGRSPQPVVLFLPDRPDGGAEQPWPERSAIPSQNRPVEVDGELLTMPRHVTYD